MALGLLNLNLFFSTIWAGFFGSKVPTVMTAQITSCHLSTLPLCLRGTWWDAGAPARPPSDMAAGSDCSGSTKCSLPALPRGYTQWLLQKLTPAAESRASLACGPVLACVFCSNSSPTQPDGGMPLEMMVHWLETAPNKKASKTPTKLQKPQIYIQRQNKKILARNPKILLSDLIFWYSQQKTEFTFFPPFKAGECLPAL